DGRDTEVQPLPIGGVPELSLPDLRIAFAPTLPGIPIAQGIRRSLERLAAQLAPLCAVVEEATPPDVNFADDLRCAGELIGMITTVFQPQPGRSQPALSKYFEALDRRDRSTLAWERFFEKWDALLCAPSMMTAFPHCAPE